jgi:hypothetical protein
METTETGVSGGQSRERRADDLRCFVGGVSDRYQGLGGWRKALARDHAHTRLAREWASDELNAFRRNLCQHELALGLADLGKTLGNAATAPKGVASKVELARRLRTVAAARYLSIAGTLNMGVPSSVRADLARLQ